MHLVNIPGQLVGIISEIVSIALFSLSKHFYIFFALGALLRVIDGNVIQSQTTGTSGLLGRWPVTRIFDLIKDKGHVPENDMYRTFNMGIGFSIIVSPQDVTTTQAFLRSQKIESFVIGKVIQDSKRKVIFN